MPNQTLPADWNPEWNDIPFSLECTDCEGCASGDGVTSPQQAHREGWTLIEHVTDSAFSNFYGLCPEHTRERAAEVDKAESGPGPEAAAGALAFSEDAIDYSTRQTVAHVEGAMQIDVARRTNGQWQRNYMILLGKFNKSCPFGVSPQFASREEAARDAIDIIGGAITILNADLKGKAAKLATKIRTALAEAMKELQP